jgi:sterol 14-demethylase
VRVKIDYDLCKGHAVCMEEAPEVFHVDDEGKVTILAEQPAADLKPKVELAKKYCPTGAISVEDE